MIPFDLYSTFDPYNRQHLKSVGGSFLHFCSVSLLLEAGALLPNPHDTKQLQPLPSSNPVTWRITKEILLQSQFQVPWGKAYWCSFLQAVSSQPINCLTRRTRQRAVRTSCAGYCNRVHGRGRDSPGRGLWADV